jgi:hypothetical protein
MGKVAEGDSNRGDPGTVIIKNLLEGLVENDVLTWDEQTVKAIKKTCGPQSKVKLTLGIKSATYAHDSRVQIDVVTGGINVIWNVDWLSYKYQSPYIVRVLDGMLNVAADPEIRGDWKLGEVKSFLEGKAELARVSYSCVCTAGLVCFHVKG